MEKRSFSRNFEKIHGFDSIFELELPPILTKPAKFNMVHEPKKKEMTEPTKFRRSSAKMEERTAYRSLPVKVVKEKSIKTWKEQKSSPPPVRRSSPRSPGVKLRVNSPRIASRKIQAYNRKALPSARSTRPRRRNLSDSLAVVKRSLNPQKDFRDSMLEMIVSYKILSSKDLEELLACYLSLNSNEYHDLIVKVFKQIWFDLADIRS